MLRSETRAARSKQATDSKNVDEEKVLGRVDAPTRREVWFARARARIPSSPEEEEDKVEYEKDTMDTDDDGEDEENAFAEDTDDDGEDVVGEMPPPTPLSKGKKWSILDSDYRAEERDASEVGEPKGKRVRWEMDTRQPKVITPRSNGYPDPWDSYKHRELLSGLVEEIRRNGTLRWPVALEAIREIGKSEKVPDNILKIARYNPERHKTEEALLGKYWTDYKAFRAKLATGDMYTREQLDSHLKGWWRVQKMLAVREGVAPAHWARWRWDEQLNMRFPRQEWAASNARGGMAGTVPPRRTGGVVPVAGLGDA